MQAGKQVRLKENPVHDMTVRGIIGDKALCDYIADNQIQEWTGGVADLEEIVEKELFATKIAPTLAGAEVKKWLDFKRVKPIKRSAYADHIGTLIQAVVYGEIEIKDDFRIVHNLNSPILDTDGRPVYSKMEYKARITAQELNEALGKSGNESEIANTIAYGSALADLPVAIMRKLDTSDLSILAALSVFFA
jgi:hypothetical protein